MNPVTKQRRSVALTEPQTSFLREEAARLGITVGELLRRIIDEYRNKKRESQNERR
jgi:hypothetical protein